MFKPPLLIVAYLCLWTTPLQLAAIGWGLILVVTTDWSMVSLTNQVFLSGQLPWLYGLAKTVWFFVFPEAVANWVLNLPFIFHVSIKAITSTLLGFWLMSLANKSF